MITVTTETALSEAIEGLSGPVHIQGGGTRGVQSDLPILSVAGLSGITLYEPGALTLVAQAGTPVSEIEDALATEGQRLAFEPGDWRGLLGTEGTPTLGGLVAANVSGPRRIAVGACRDFALGVRYVDGRGQVVKNGGRVMKNVTGYDLVKLMSGSWGTLGVLSEVSLKVLAKPETEATLIYRGKDTAAAIADLSAALGTPYDVTGAAYVADDKRVQVRVEGFAESVSYRIKQLQAGALQGYDVAEGDASAALWAEARDVTPFAGTTETIWRISVAPTKAAQLSRDLADAGLSHRAIYDWGGGLIWLAIDADCDAQQMAALRPMVQGAGGHATLMRARNDIANALPKFHAQAAPIEALAAGLRAKFDPKGLLNPGLMG